MVQSECKIMGTCKETKTRALTGAESWEQGHESNILVYITNTKVTDILDFRLVTKPRFERRDGMETCLYTNVSLFCAKTTASKETISLCTNIHLSKTNCFLSNLLRFANTRKSLFFSGKNASLKALLRFVCIWTSFFSFVFFPFRFWFSFLFLANKYKTWCSTVYRRPKPVKSLATQVEGQVKIFSLSSIAFCRISWFGSRHK